MASTLPKEFWDQLAADVGAELVRARRKFPNTLYHLGEELRQAMADQNENPHNLVHASHVDRVIRNMNETRAKLRKELVQTMAMCVRLQREGDPLMNVEPGE